MSSIKGDECHPKTLFSTHFIAIQILEKGANCPQLKFISDKEGYTEIWEKEGHRVLGTQDNKY